MIFKSDFPRVDIPNIDIPSFCIMEGKRRYMQSSRRCEFAISDGSTGKSMDIYEIEKASQSFASGLVHRIGFKFDQVLALFTPNTIYYPVVVYGTQMIGGIVTMANPTYTPRELAHQLKDSNSVAIATQSDLLEVTKKAIQIAGVNIPDSNIILLDIYKNSSEYAHIEELYCDKPFEVYKIATEEEAERKIAVLPYSSGTTGVAKGVMLTHKNILASIIMNSCFGVYDNWFDRSKYPPKFVGVLPFYHIYGFGSILNLGISMSIGVIVMPKFNSDLMLEIIEKHKIQFAHLVPPIIVGLVNNPNVHKYELSSLKGIRTASAPMGKDHLNKFYKIFKNVGVVRAYGLTETSPTLTNSFMGHPNDGSSGVLLSNVEAKVIDPSGNLLDYNQEGELCFRGPNIMKGYLNNPEANKVSLDEDGFFHTGDTGFVDKKGNFYVVGRIKELIKYKGFQVAPPELEGLLLDHKDVSDSAVIGVYNEEQATEFPKAFITLTSNLSNLPETEKLAKAQEIKKWLEELVAPHKRLRGGIEVIEVIPKNPSGKILKNVLKEREMARINLNKVKNKL